MDQPHEIMREAARFIGKSVKPVARVKEGSSGRTPFGSAFVVSHQGQHALVSAAHVVEGPEIRYVGISTRSTMRWPSPFARVRALSEDYADPDVAVARIRIPAEAPPGASDAIPLGLAFPLHVAMPGHTYLAVGHPVSKSKMRYNPRVLKAATAFLTGEAVPEDNLGDVGLDKRVHLAMVYDRHALEYRPRGAGAGPQPQGMSGGPLFVLAEGVGGAPVFLLVGVLTEFRKGPPEVIAATRIEAVLDHLAPFRPKVRRAFVGAG